MSPAAGWRRLATASAAIVMVLYFAEQLLPGVFARHLPPVDRVVVRKADRRMTLYSANEPVATYSISLGADPTGQKTWRGDSRTPEGTYVLDYRNAESGFYRSIHISYPNEADRAAGRAADVPTGGNVMIHGMPGGRAWIGPFYKFEDWTDGCISVTNREMAEIWRAVPDGTPIEIGP